MAMVGRGAHILIFFILLFTTGCKKTFIGDEPNNSYSDNFEILWNDFDKFYSFFDVKSVNWDSLYSVYKPLAENTTSDREFFNLISKMLEHLRDGHVNLYSPFDTYSYTTWKSDYPENFNLDNVRRNYLSDVKLPDNSSIYLTASIDNSVGYIWIESFGRNSSTYKKLDQILKNFESLDGLIIDIRNNGGGSDLNSRYVASRFLTEKKIYRLYRYRNGPDHNDFTEFHKDYLEPEGFHFSKPVIVLTNRSVFSAAEDFVLAMRQGDNVTFVGDNTGGGSGNPMFRELPNGWVFRLSRWQVVIPESMKQYENTGLAPDLRVDNSQADMENGRDTILDTGLQVIENKASKNKIKF